MKKIFIASLILVSSVVLAVNSYAVPFMGDGVSDKVQGNIVTERR